MTIQSGPNTPVRIGNNLKTFSMPDSSSALKKSVAASGWVGCLYRKIAPIVLISPWLGAPWIWHAPSLLTPFRYTREGKSGYLEPSKNRRPNDVSFGPSSTTIFDGPNDPLSRRPLASESVKISTSSLWKVSRSCARRNAYDIDRLSSSGITNKRGALDERMRESRPDGWISGTQSSGYVI